MLMEMIILMTMASVIIEAFIAWNLPFWRKITSKYRILDIVFSLALSWFLGLMFGAQGVVIAISAVASTMLSMPVYPAMDWAEKNMEQIKIHVDQCKQASMGFFMLVVLVGKTLFLVLSIPFKVMTWWTTRKMVVQSLSASVASE